MAEDVLTLAARYLESVVEDLELCPYAGPARLAGRLRMEAIDSGKSAAECAALVAERGADGLIEAILLVFDLDAADPRREARAFEGFLREFQRLHRATDGAAF